MEAVPELDPLPAERPFFSDKPAKIISIGEAATRAFVETPEDLRRKTDLKKMACEVAQLSIELRRTLFALELDGDKVNKLDRGKRERVNLNTEQLMSCLMSYSELLEGLAQSECLPYLRSINIGVATVHDGAPAIENLGGDIYDIEEIIPEISDDYIMHAERLNINTEAKKQFYTRKTHIQGWDGSPNFVGNRNRTLASFILTNPEGVRCALEMHKRDTFVIDEAFADEHLGKYRDELGTGCYICKSAADYIDQQIIDTPPELRDPGIRSVGREAYVRVFPIDSEDGQRILKQIQQRRRTR